MYCIKRFTLADSKRRRNSDSHKGTRDIENKTKFILFSKMAVIENIMKTRRYSFRLLEYVIKCMNEKYFLIAYCELCTFNSNISYLIYNYISC